MAVGVKTKTKTKRCTQAYFYIRRGIEYSKPKKAPRFGLRFSIAGKNMVVSYYSLLVCQPLSFDPSLAKSKPSIDAPLFSLRLLLLKFQGAFPFIPADDYQCVN